MEVVYVYMGGSSLARVERMECVVGRDEVLKMVVWKC